jgi:hypothetical protein
MNKLFLTFLIAIFLFAFVSPASLPSLGTFEQGQTVRITQVCSDATYINISSVSYPNSTIAVSNIEMTSAGSGEFYYDFTSTNPLGRYDVRQISDGCEKTFAYYFEINLSGIQKDTTLIVSNIFLILLILVVIYVLHDKYKGANYKDSNKKIGQSHTGNWGRTFMKTLGNNLMRNSFLWYYSLGWLLLIVLKELVSTFNSIEVYNFFVLVLDIYSFGFFLIIVVWIGILIHHFRFITDLISDLNLGVSE